MTTKRRATSEARVRTLSLATELVGKPVIAGNGRRLGTVIDVAVAMEGRNWSVEALELGRYGLLDRWHLTRPIIRRLAHDEDLRLVAWADVERVEPRAIRLSRAKGA